MTIYKPGDVVEVPFPFIDTPDKKLRPALVLPDSRFQASSGACVLMMVTSALRSRWDSDIEITDWQESGLRKPSVLRLKIFTIDEGIIGSIRGTLSVSDQKKVRESLGNYLSHWINL